jgi:hypothetical protein
MTNPTSSDPFPGAIVGRWRILEHVGSGNNGITYRVCLAERPGQAEKQAGPVADERVVPSRCVLPTKRATRPGPTRWHLVRQALHQHSLHLAAASALAAGVLTVVLLPPRPSLDIEEEPEHLAAVEAGEEEEENAGADERTVGLADGGMDGVLTSAEAWPSHRVPGEVLAPNASELRNG